MKENQLIKFFLLTIYLFSITLQYLPSALGKKPYKKEIQ